MRPVVLAMFVSLDGYINGPAGAFAGPPFSPDLKTHWMDRNMQRSDVMMYGRVCYEGMEQYWTSQHDDPQAKDLANREKLVFSNTLTEAKWGRVRIVRDADIATEIAKLKAQPGKDIVLIGGAGIANTFLRRDLVDELSLLVMPTLLGGGTRLFQDTAPLRLKLIESLPFDTGMVRLTYRRA